SLQQASGSGTVALEELVSGALRATDVKLRATLRGGVLTLDEATAAFYGGEVRADGTTANLAEPLPTWTLAAALDGVDLGEAMDSIGGRASVGGTLDSRVDLRGAGADWEAMRDALTGSAALELQQGQLATLDLDRAIAGALADGLRQLGQNASAD